MKSTIRLFKAIEIKSKRKKKCSSKLLTETVKRGFIFSPEVVFNYTNTQLSGLISVVENEIGLTPEKMNASFHKSWKKVRDTDILQLVLEQIVHYITVYGFERLGVYDENSVYLPSEDLNIPEIIDKEIKLTVINGYTKDELKIKLLDFLATGIALSEDTINDVLNVVEIIDLTNDEVDSIRNKEVKIALYDKLKIFPKNPVEFLRYIIYQAIGKTLLIKDIGTIEALKEQNHRRMLYLFKDYESKYGLENLAQIFYRFKPLFLAFKGTPGLNKYVNKIRKLAVKHHKPMQPDYLNSITAMIKQGYQIDEKLLTAALNEVSSFRKIRLAYALKFRTKDADAILYRIRNGKGYATEFDFRQKDKAKEVLSIVLDSLTNDLRKNVENKKIYIPEYINYALPATEKQFTGDFPSGTYVSIPKNMIAGIYWENQPEYRVDLDLSIINEDIGKIGWDSSYRTEDRDILFSGDVTDASRGASELFYIKKQAMQSFIMLVNYYNYNADIEVPFKILVAQEQLQQLKKNYMVDPNKMLCIAKTKINQRQKILGLLVTTTKECRFYFAELYLGQSITASGSEFVFNAKKYLFNFYRNTINLNELLEEAGGILVQDKQKCDIDLSPETLEKDTIINLIK